MAEIAEQITDTLVLDYIKKKDPSLGMKVSKKWNAPELPPGSPDVKEVVTHFLKTNKKRRESLEVLTPAKKSKTDKSTPKTNGVTNGAAKSGKTNGHAKSQSDSSSEESSDEEPQKPVVAKKTPGKSPKVVRPTAPVEESSSEESSSDEEKPVAKKAATPKATPKQAPKKESSSSDDSSDEDEPPKKTQAPKVVAKVVAKKESSSSEEDSSEEEPPKKAQKPAKVTKPAPKEESSSEESSDDEPPKPKVAPKQTPKVQAKPAAKKESSDDSDSSDESEAETKKPVPAKKVVPAKAAAKAESSSDEDSSSDEEEEKKPAAKKSPVKPAAKKETSDDDSSDEEEQPPKKAVKKQAKKDSSSSEESSSDEEKEVAKPAAPLAGEKRKRESEGGAEFGNQQKFIKADAAMNGDWDSNESYEVFVNRIGTSMTDDHLYEHFKQFGNIERTKIVTDRETGESRGFGFVTFSSPAEAKAAAAHGGYHTIEGVECMVRLSEPKPGMGGGQPKFGGNSSVSESGESKELFVNRLDYTFTDDHLSEYFKQFGCVERAKVATDRETGESRGFAFITFSTPEEAKAAVAKGPTHSIDGSEFCVRLAEPKSNDGGMQQFTAPQSTLRRKSEPFRRVREEEVVVDPKFTNAFTFKRGAENDWGFRAHQALIKTRGKGFRHEKNKKKKGSYSGGTISTAITSIKFD